MCLSTSYSSTTGLQLLVLRLSLHVLLLESTPPVFLAPANVSLVGYLDSLFPYLGTEWRIYIRCMIPFGSANDSLTALLTDSADSEWYMAIIRLDGTNFPLVSNLHGLQVLHRSTRTDGKPFQWCGKKHLPLNIHTKCVYNGDVLIKKRTPLVN